MHTRSAVLLAVAMAAASLGACKDSDIPFLTAPTTVAATAAGIQNGLTGVFAATRIDIGTQVITIGASYARDGAVFTNTEPRTVTYPLGVQHTPNTSGAVWPQEYQNIRQAQQVLATIPKVAPAYTTAQAASLTGIVQTITAYNYMILAEAHDTLGIAILPNAVLTTPPPAVCNPDAWAYIVALLDSANTNLTAAGAQVPPIQLPTGFAGVGHLSGPSTALGSFASFNRALAAKANLELAYAVARLHAGTSPTPASPGAPQLAALTTALTDITTSAMWDTTSLVPNTAGGFVADAHTVTHDFSASSGDLVNPIDGSIGTEAMLNDFVASVDTINDLRWKAKFVLNPNSVQQQLYNPVASKYIYDMSPSTGSTIPIVRAEELTFVAAEIELGLGNYATAIALANGVRTKVGGLTPTVVTPTYAAARDFVMQEQRISTTWESSDDRTIAIRMFGMATVSDTTWLHEDPAVTTGDLHTTVNPIPQTELNGRGGSFVTSCSM